MKENLYKAGVMLLAFTQPLHNMLLAVFVLLAFDFLTGIAAAMKRKEPIRSHRMVNTVSKAVFYSLGILVSNVVERWLFPTIPWVQVIASFVAISEMYSVYENLSIITGKDLLTHLKEQILTFKKPGAGATAVVLLVLLTSCGPKVPAATTTTTIQAHRIDTLLTGIGWQELALPMGTPFLFPLPGQSTLTITNTPEGVRAQGSWNEITTTITQPVAVRKIVDRRTTINQSGETNTAITGKKPDLTQANGEASNAAKKIHQPTQHTGTGDLEKDTGFKLPWYVWLFLVLCLAALAAIKFL